MESTKNTHSDVYILLRSPINIGHYISCLKNAGTKCHRFESIKLINDIHTIFYVK